MTKLPKEPLVAVIRDPRDATRDYYLPYSVAKALYSQGHLSYDLTNHAFFQPAVRRSSFP